MTDPTVRDTEIMLSSNEKDLIVVVGRNVEKEDVFSVVKSVMMLDQK